MTKRKYKKMLDLRGLRPVFIKKPTQREMLYLSPELVEKCLKFEAEDHPILVTDYDNPNYDIDVSGFCDD